AGGISKLLTATAALQLVEQQHLALDAPIQQTLREFYVRSRFHKAITAQSSATCKPAFPGRWLGTMWRDCRLPWSMARS
ncbi:serine hydrolase, partial [Pseudomonas sp. MF6751]|uniref:serine hydrolase n=1 Tax=Pseudomonas sp. MF6751 TaxID=2797528 RepID=UPI00190AF7BA